MGLLDPLRNQLAAESEQRCVRASARMTADLKRNAPVVTGETKRQTGVEVRSTSRTLITAVAEINTDYAEVVVYDTRPHVIRARPGKVLAFNWPRKGGVVFFHSVNHPGTKGNPWFFDTIKRWGEYLSAS